MGSMNKLANPVFPYTRQDGRSLYPAGQLNFVPGFLRMIETPEALEILKPGLLVGAVVRCLWTVPIDPTRSSRDWRSARVHLIGMYTGESEEIAYSSFYRARHTADMPLFDVDIWHDNGARTAIGSVAIGHLEENESPVLGDVNTVIIQRALKLEEGATGLRFGKVQVGGLYYVPPQAS